MFVRGSFLFLIPLFCLSEETVKIGLTGQQVSSLTDKFFDEIAMTESPGSDHEEMEGLVLSALETSLSSVREALLSSSKM